MQNIEKIKELLGKNSPEIIYYETTDSTNTRAKEYAKDHRENREPKVFIAHSQSAGRGRLGKSFCSKEGAGLYITFLLYPDKCGSDITAYTPFAAVKLCECVEEKTSLKPNIKWVNDLYVNDKKLAGILVEGEMNSQGKIGYLICGLGINVYKTPYPDEISHIAISIEEASGEKIIMEEFTAALIKKLACEPSDFTDGSLFSEYKKRLSTIGQRVTVIKPLTKYDATVKDLNPDYSLSLILPNGSEETLFTGEVSIKKR